MPLNGTTLLRGLPSRSANLLAALLLGWYATAYAANPSPLAHSMTAHSEKVAAPALKLGDLDGRVHDLAALRGKVVLVNFWATWCPPCRREMPSLQRLQDKLQGEPFVVLAVDIGEEADTVAAYARQLPAPLSFPLLLDSHSRSMQTWQIRGLPATYLIDKSGRIAYSALGGREFDHPEIEQVVRDLLKR